MKGLLLTILLLMPTPSHGVEEEVDYEEFDDICVYLPDTEPEYSEEALAAALQASDYAVKLADLLKTETDRGRAYWRKGDLMTQAKYYHWSAMSISMIETQGSPPCCSVAEKGNPAREKLAVKPPTQIINAPGRQK